MIKHMEQLWEEAEFLTEKDGDSLEVLFEDLIVGCQKLKSSSDESLIIDSYGSMLFIMAALSKKLNINVYTALKKAMDDVRKDHLDDEENAI